jgi:hypothetical protein
MNHTLRAFLLAPLIAIPMVAANVLVTDWVLFGLRAFDGLGLSMASAEALFAALLSLALAAAVVLIGWYPLTIGLMFPLHWVLSRFRIRLAIAYILGFTLLVAVWDFIASDWFRMQRSLTTPWVAVLRSIIDLMTATAVSWCFWRMAVKPAVPSSAA